MSFCPTIEIKLRLSKSEKVKLLRIQKIQITPRMDVILKFFEKHFPLNKAASWDNTGHLIQIPVNKIKKTLLTNDLTETVIDESVEKNVDVIITYHPILFKPIQIITPFYTKIIQNNINVYAFHTTADSFMTYEFLSKVLPVEKSEYVPEILQSEYTSYFVNEKHTNEYFIKRIKEICRIDRLRVAFGKNQNLLYNPQEVHFGCGSAEFPIVKNSLIITGEMPHHPILAENSRNNTVVLLEHCQSERWFLGVLKKLLNQEIEGLDVVISENDKSPIQII